MGSLHNIDFGVFWASWGGSGKEPGPGNRFRVEPFLGTLFLEPGRGIEKVPGSGDSVPKVPKVTLFRRYTFVL